jgi:hypothetical protein
MRLHSIVAPCALNADDLKELQALGENKFVAVLVGDIDEPGNIGEHFGKDVQLVASDSVSITEEPKDE